MRSKGWMIAMILLLFMGIGATLGVMEWKKTHAAFLNSHARLILGDAEIGDEGEPFVDDTGIYLPYGLVQKHMGEDIFLSEDRKRVFIPLMGKETQLEDARLTEMIQDNGIIINIPVKNLEGEIYIPIELLQKIYGFQVSISGNGKAVFVDAFTEKQLWGVVVADQARLTPKPTPYSLALERLHKDSQVRILAEGEGWVRVRSEAGNIGYLNKQQVLAKDEVQIVDFQLNQRREDFRPEGKKINLAWEYVHEKSPKLTGEERIEALDVIAPTWFSVADEEGTVLNKADRRYVEEAHKKGYQVWALVENSFNPDLTTKILNNKALRSKVIGQLVFYASLYNLDGINVDFENMYYGDQAAFVAFMEELKDQIKLQNLVLSVDVTVPSSSERWSKVYDRKALADIVDYVAIMTYDEHWGSSPVSGSVASIGWVERGIQRSLELIPEEKVLMGLPFYTRVWREFKDENGKNRVESKAISMVRAREIILEKKADVRWDEKAGQYFAQYEENGDQYKIWLEDPRSIALKASLVGKYRLAGTAAWRRGFEDEAVWPVLQDMIKQGRDHKELVFHNPF
ncbi:Glycosyl hydrolases family 18 [Geosporobacter subterraneus DSM 17957]|uniref:Glycosyl hydrolases family 18 n=1 Tax=Geosporobacter subterraneus DSM 17957 TaxID=1121919 RepID=A0A1M6EVK2_9FIRM|nr:glycosyl hydrolase family 18 protein [Geosporobacter subterraneus]SHI89440.1 Glycosyl hydrolases family 18 [Geosporobacter subterraneus DSM 17957]